MVSLERVEQAAQRIDLQFIQGKPTEPLGTHLFLHKPLYSFIPGILATWWVLSRSHLGSEFPAQAARRGGQPYAPAAKLLQFLELPGPPSDASSGIGDWLGRSTLCTMSAQYKAHAVWLGYSQVFLLQMEMLLYWMEKKIVFKSTWLKAGSRLTSSWETDPVWVAHKVGCSKYLNSLLYATKDRNLPAPGGNLLDLFSL